MTFKQEVCSFLFHQNKCFPLFFSTYIFNESHLLLTKSCANYAIHKLSYKLVSQQKITQISNTLSKWPKK